MVSATMDNVEYMTKCLNEQLWSLFLNAIHVRCISHIYNLIWTVFWEHPNMKCLRTFGQRVCTFFKGKRYIPCSVLRFKVHGSFAAHHTEI